MANIYKRWLCEESLKTPSSRPILIYFEFRSKPSLITVICMDPHSPNKLFVTKYCFLIQFSFSISFFPFSFLFFLFCYFTLLLIFTKIILLLLLLFFFFFMKTLLFFHVPVCSGIFGSVPACSVFRVLSTPVES